MDRICIALIAFFWFTAPVVAAAAEEKIAPPKSIALIIDASGSMQAKLKSGQKRIDAAKDAVETVLNKTSDDVRLALRAYGHQSHRRKKDCKDTQLLTGFMPLGENRDDVIAKARGLTAQGYTPISLVLEKAANDLKAEGASGSRVVVLVSDGKETCKGDPCAVVKALMEADANLVVHTIGFAVDVAARYELQCIAKYGHGTYFEADDADKLAEKLSTAVETITIREAINIELPKKAEPGTLRLKETSGSRHTIFESLTMKDVGSLSQSHRSVTLPAGFYQVKFGNSFWRSIEVKDGEVTQLDTAILKIPTASYRGHLVLDWETGEEIDRLSSVRSSGNIIPTTVNVMFGTIAIKLDLKAGEVKVIEASTVSFSGLPQSYRSIFSADGVEIITVSHSGSTVTLPPGDYYLEHDDQKFPFTIKPGINKYEIGLK